MSSKIFEVINLIPDIPGMGDFSPLTFSLAPMDKVILSGASGSGKTSVLRTLLGFVEIQDGTILYFGEPLTPSLSWSIRKNCCYVPQNVDTSDLTVEEEWTQIKTFSANRHNRVLSDPRSFFEKFYLPTDLWQKQLSVLSGGEKQRVALCFSIALNKQVYLLDEVTAALDEKSTEAVVRHFSETEKTVIVISHDSAWTDLYPELFTVVDVA